MLLSVSLKCCFGDLTKLFLGGDQNDSIGYADQEKLAGNQEKTKFLFRRMLFKKSVDGKKTADLAEKPLLNYSVDGTPAVIQSRKDSFFDLSLASTFRYFASGASSGYRCGLGNSVLRAINDIR